VGDEEGYRPLVVSPEGILEWAALDASPPATVPTIPVRVTTVDKLRSDLPAPTLIKLDVEGAEDRALLGMHETLMGDRPAVVCEVHASLARVRALFEAENYEVVRLGAADGGEYCQVLGRPR
jgi:FkbM family methyltransferase